MFGQLAFEGGAGLGMPSGGFGSEVLAEMYKALTLGSGTTDIANLTGGAALRLQSIEQTLIALIQTNKDFRLYNLLNKTPARASIDEWSEESAIGGFPGGTFNTELGAINESTSVLARRFIQIKFMMTMRAVSLIKQIEGGLADPQALEQANGALELLTDCEWGLFYGDGEVVPTQFDGIIKLTNSLAPENVVDLGGQPISNDASEIVQASRRASERRNWGSSSHVFVSSKVQGDLDEGLDPAVRIGVETVNGPRNDGILRGNPVVGIKSSFGYDGRLQMVYDKFIEESQGPAEAGPDASYYSDALNAGVVAPASVALAVASDAASKFGAAHAGNYYYAVEGVNNNGRRSVVTKSSVQAVAQGEKVTLTITDGSSPNITGYIVHRSRKNGSNATADFREIGKVAKAAGSTTAFVDFNRSIPGTSCALVLNLSPGHQALTIRRLLPMMKFPLFPTNNVKISWAQLMGLALRNTKPRQHVVLKNILPKTAEWRPF